MEFREFTGKTVEDAFTEARIALGVTSDQIEYEVINEGSTGLFGVLGKKEAVIKARKKNSVEDVVAEFLSEVLEKMDMPAEVVVSVDDVEKVINVNLEGNVSSDVIGKKGQNLDALQYLASIVANGFTEEYYRLKLDTQNYRERRQKTLENLAKNTANKVKKTRHKIALDPMNPYERRIIHAYLQGDNRITTKSEGDEPYRKVVIYYNK